ncbi:MAG: acyl-ACP--UDP-N-acetylglucosamine O-acyltransferase, partial [Candidatus Omnitrophica bacterium]|nr:acyl-ACP--UDP-N-acetylglucosamine O-acyltransferase [Candidatus Omnitrophota bacterium]
MSHKIHPTAIVSSDATLGEGVEIGPHSVIEGNSVIGDGCVLQSNVFIDRNTFLGKENFLGHGVVLGTPPQDKKFDPNSNTRLVVGDKNIFREYCTVNRATGDGAETRIGSGCLLMTQSHVGHNCHLGDEVILSNIATLAGHVDVHDWVIMGGLVAIPQFTRLGKGAFLGGFSAMRLDLPPFFRYSGRPAEPVGVNHVGMTRRGIPEENIRVVRKAYRILYRSGLVLEKAMEQIQEEFG